MKLIYLISFVLVLTLAGSAQADNIWTDVSGSGLWNDALNWSEGHVPAYGDGGNQVINTLPGPSVQAAGMGANNIWMTGTSDMTIDGGELSVSSDLMVSDWGTAIFSTLTVNSGTLNVDGTAHVAYYRTGTLNMNGGTFTANNFNVATFGGSTGHVNLYDGIIDAENFVMGVGAGTMDIEAGTLIIDGDARSTVQEYIDNGWITAYDGDGTLYLDYDLTNTGKTTLKTTPHFLNPIPADGSSVPLSLNQLQWTLPEPNSPGGFVTCNVYFGTNPPVPTDPWTIKRKPVESLSVTLAPDTMYYWLVHIYDSGISDTWPIFMSPVFTFTVENQPPIVNAGDDVPTWLVDGERVVPLDGFVSDEDGGPGPATLEWTVIAEPNELNPAEISDPLAANTTVTVKELGSYTLQLEAGDGEFTATDTMQITVYADSCEHAQNQEGFEQLAGDINHDCKVDFVDFANFAASWLQENYSTE